MTSLSTAMLLVMTCGTYANSADLEQSFLPRHKRYSDSSILISSAMYALQEVTTEVKNVVVTFGETQIIKKFQPIIERTSNSLQNISERVNNYLSRTFTALPNCLVTLYDDIKEIFGLVLENIVACGAPPILKGVELWNTLYQSINNWTVQYYGEFHNCFERSNIVDITVCLGEVVHHIEIKGIDLLIQSFNDLGHEIETVLPNEITLVALCGTDLLHNRASDIADTVTKFVYCIIPPEPNYPTVPDDNNTIIIHYKIPVTKTL